MSTERLCGKVVKVTDSGAPCPSETDEVISLTDDAGQQMCVDDAQ
jgi:hypothetical protein